MNNRINIVRQPVKVNLLQANPVNQAEKTGSAIIFVILDLNQSYSVPSSAIIILPPLTVSRLVQISVPHE